MNGLHLKPNDVLITPKEELFSIKVRSSSVDEGTRKEKGRNAQLLGSRKMG